MKVFVIIFSIAWFTLFLAKITNSLCNFCTCESNVCSGKCVGNCNPAKSCLTDCDCSADCLAGLAGSSTSNSTQTLYTLHPSSANTIISSTSGYYSTISQSSSNNCSCIEWIDYSKCYVSFSSNNYSARFSVNCFKTSNCCSFPIKSL